MIAKIGRLELGTLFRFVKLANEQAYECGKQCQRQVAARTLRTKRRERDSHDDDG